MKKARMIILSVIFVTLCATFLMLGVDVASKEPIDEGKICPTCRPYQRSNRIKEDRLYCEQCYDEYEEKERKRNLLDSEAKARFHARIAMWHRYENLDQACSSGAIDKCDWTCIAHRDKPDPNKAPPSN